MSDIFISHSRDNEDLIDRIERALNHVGYNAVIFEQEDVRENESDREAIIRLMRSCMSCFVFPTPEARSSTITSSWLISESTIAQEKNIPTVIFKERTDIYGINFPYFNTLVVYDEHDLPLDLQDIAEDAAQTSEDEGAILGGIGAGLIFGPGGILPGVILGALLSGETEESNRVECHACGHIFTYIGKPEQFKCPHCHSSLNASRDSI